MNLITNKNKNFQNVFIAMLYQSTDSPLVALAAWFLFCFVWLLCLMHSQGLLLIFYGSTLKSQRDETTCNLPYLYTYFHHHLPCKKKLYTMTICLWVWSRKFIPIKHEKEKSAMRESTVLLSKIWMKKRHRAFKLKIMILQERKRRNPNDREMP